MPAHETITRRHLPHWYVPGAAHFVTYRLAGTIPQDVLDSLRAKKESRLSSGLSPGTNAQQHRERVHKQFFADYDRFLDRVSKVNWLMKPEIAALIRGSLYHHQEAKYHLLAYTVMPNHVHVLLQPMDLAAESHNRGDEQEDSRSPLAEIMHSLKGYTANVANRLLNRTGQLWQHESYDHWVREEELERIVDYLSWNPVKAGLVREPHHWFFSSAHDRFLQDGHRSGFLRPP